MPHAAPIDCIEPDPFLGHFGVVLPLPPSANRTYRTTRTGGFYRSPEATNWLKQAVWIIQAAAPRRLGIDTHLAIEVGVYSQARRDVDAGLKLLIDAIAEAVGVDDARVMELSVTKHIAAKSQHRCVVTVRELPE